MARRYIRVIPKETERSLNDIGETVAELIDANDRVSQIQPPTKHPRGGYSVFLDFDDAQIEPVLNYLRQNGWLPCI